MGCGSSTSMVRDRSARYSWRKPLARDGSRWLNTGMMNATLAPAARENRGFTDGSPLVSFPARATASSPSYAGDDYGGGVTYDWDFYYRCETFYPFSWAEGELVRLLVSFVVESGFVQEFRIPEDALNRLMGRVAEVMRAQPYHCFEHICDVTQAVFLFINAPTSVLFLPPLHRLAVLLAAVMHDLDHPGYTNLYLKHSQHELTAKYGPDGTLEKHHAALARAILSSKDTDVLVNCTAHEKTECHRLIEKCILATDMSRHKAIVEDVLALMPRNYEAVVKRNRIERKASRMSLEHDLLERERSEKESREKRGRRFAMHRVCQESFEAQEAFLPSERIEPFEVRPSLSASRSSAMRPSAVRVSGFPSLEPASISRSSQSCSSEGDSSNALPFKTGLKKAAGAEEASVRTEEKEMVADAGRNLSSNLRFSREMDREREGVGREGEGGGTVSSEEEPLSEKETLLRVPGAVVQKVVPKVVVKVVHERAKREGTEGAQKEAHEETSETSACEGEGLLISKFLPALGEGGKRVRGSHGLTSMQAPRTAAGVRHSNSTFASPAFNIRLRNRSPSVPRAGLTVPGEGPAKHLFDRRRSSIDKLLRSGQSESVLLLFIKAADLSNVARPAHSNERWVSRINTEFHRQGRAELAAQYPLSPGMGENDSVAKGQVFFGGAICRPLFVMLAGVIPEVGPFLDQLDANLARWKAAGILDDEAKARLDQINDIAQTAEAMGLADDAPVASSR